MKKIIFIVSLLFAFSLNANAQDAKTSTSVQDNARKEAAMLAETVGLTGTQTDDFFRLFEMKYQTLEDKNLSQERKNEFLNIVMMKVQATLDERQMKKLEANTVLYERIKSGPKAK